MQRTMSPSRLSAFAVLSPLLLAASGVVASIAACAGGDDSTQTVRDATEPDGSAAVRPDAATDAGRDAGKTKPDAGGKTTPSDEEADAEPTTEAECASLTTQQGCFVCCSQYHKPGYATYYNALRSCACGASGQCAKECGATACTGPNVAPDAACRACLDKVMAPSTGACVQPVTAACSPDADCVAMYMCSTKCPP